MPLGIITCKYIEIHEQTFFECFDQKGSDNLSTVISPNGCYSNSVFVDLKEFFHPFFCNLTEKLNISKTEYLLIINWRYLLIGTSAYETTVLSAVHSEAFTSECERRQEKTILTRYRASDSKWKLLILIGLLSRVNGAMK